jgi:hypothetical protein
VKESDRRFIATWKSYLKRIDAVFGRHRMNQLRQVASDYFVEVCDLDKKGKVFAK